MFELFVNKRFSRPMEMIIEKANEIIEEYSAQGYTLTLRQLYYQFVSRDLIPNRQNEYKRLGNVISDARLAGMIDWNAIEDRTRNMASHDGVWDSPQQIIESAAGGYARPYWANQPYHVEVWVEKEALAGVIETICRPLKVSTFACKGYTSQSEMYHAGKRLKDAIIEGGKSVRIIHLGDHDPSGIDMSRDITDRLSMFSEHDIEVKRIALNFDQIKQYNPPPNPAKATDCRFASYRKKYGTESWELDALNPSVLKGLITEAVTEVIDRRQWNLTHGQETREKGILSNIVKNYDKVIKLL